MMSFNRDSFAYSLSSTVSIMFVITVLGKVEMDERERMQLRKESFMCLLLTVMSSIIN